MFSFKKTKDISCDLLAEQLLIDPLLIFDDGEGNIVIKTEIDASMVEKAMKAHKIPEPVQPTIQEKLAAAGIDLDDLRVALGL